MGALFFSEQPASVRTNRELAVVPLMKVRLLMVLTMYLLGGINPRYRSSEERPKDAPPDSFILLLSCCNRRYLEAIQTCTLLLSSLFDEAERGDSFTTRATPEVLSETVWFNDFQPT